MPSRNSARKRRLSATAALCLIVPVSLTGCFGQGGNPPVEERNVAIGSDADIGEVDVRSLLIVSDAESNPGRLLGTISTRGEEPVEVTIADQDDSVSVTVEPGQDYAFDTNPAIFDTISEPPGAQVPITVEVGSESLELLVLVMDGTLEEYAPYLPSPSPSATPAV